MNNSYIIIVLHQHIACLTQVLLCTQVYMILNDDVNCFSLCVLMYISFLYCLLNLKLNEYIINTNCVYKHSLMQFS